MNPKSHGLPSETFFSISTHFFVMTTDEDIQHLTRVPRVALEIVGEAKELEPCDTLAQIRAC